MDFFRYDFGYSWPWNYGHLVACGIFVVLAGLTWWRGWPRPLLGLASALAVWAFVGFLVTQLVIRFNLPIQLPTEGFLREASGPLHVLDVGAGSGRASVTMLRAWPVARVTALDLYDGYFGIVANTPERLFANAAVAGARDRIDATVGDMRAMPFDDQVFDAVISVAAIDHLRRADVERALAEVARVLRPDGEFLLMVINPDGWTRLAYPLFLHHGYFDAATNHDFWRSSVGGAGFDIVELGTRPATLYVLARKGRALAGGPPVEPPPPGSS